MKIKNKISLLLVLLTLLFTLTLTLSSCGDTAAGSDVIYSKEEILASVNSEKNEDRGLVWEYLDHWKFPAFDKAKLRKTENLYRKKYYEEIPSSYYIATEIANAFLEETYDNIDLSNSQKVTDALLYSFVEVIGDPYSFYRTNEQFEDYTSEMSGTKPAFYGIGVNVRTILVDGGILVIKPIRNSPAYKAGVLANDIIIAIDGVSVAETGYDAAVESIKGEAGTKVALTIKRGEDTLEITVTRAPVVNPTVDYELSENKIGYIDINAFKGNTDELFIEAIDYMVENGAKALIYDVRYNGGGYLETVVNMLDYIAKDGTTLASFSNDYASSEKSNDGHSLSLPTVVVCNASSASASELFTQGLRDLGEMGQFDVTVVGQTTYGKFVMQNTYTLHDDSAITLTVAYYYSPLGKQFNGVGISPNVDITVGLDDKEIEKLSDSDYLDPAFLEAEKLIQNK